MQISAMPPASHALAAAKVPERKEAPGPDHDGDSDDAAAVSASASRATPPAGTGSKVDISA